MSAPSRYRAIGAPIIARVLAESRGLPEAEVQARLHAAYPFGARVNHPYKIWREEIRAQGGPPPAAGRPPAARAGRKGGSVPAAPEPWSPPRLRCRGCVHLGPTRPVTDHRGLKRVRRQCDCAPHGFTDIDWPACPHFQVRLNPELPQ